MIIEVPCWNKDHTKRKTAINNLGVMNENISVKSVVAIVIDNPIVHVINSYILYHVVIFFNIDQ